MAKAKQIIQKECNKCVNSKVINNELYCLPKLKDEATLTNYAKANVTLDCLFYREVKR